MWVTTKTDPPTLVNLAHASTVLADGSTVVAYIAGKQALLARCGSADEAAAILLRIEECIGENFPTLNLAPRP